MQNAHERFGTLEFIKRTKGTTTRVRAYIDRVVVEPAQNEQGQASAHLISMIGGDSEIGAMWAAVTEAELLHTMVHVGAQSAKSDPIFVGTGMLTRGGQREQAHISQIDWQGLTGRVYRNTERQWINNLEVAEDFPGAVAARCSRHCHLILKANQRDSCASF